MSIGRCFRGLSRGRRLPAAGRWETRVARVVRLLLAGAAALGAVFLVLFHSWLLWLRLSDFAILEPTIALRWLGALVLLVALLWLRRAPGSLLWGRKAVVFWLLVLLLHTNGLVGSLQGGRDDPGRAASQLLVVLPVTVGLATALRIASPGVFKGRRFEPVPAASAASAAASLPPTLRPNAGFYLPVCSRPPPL